MIQRSLCSFYARSFSFVLALIGAILFSSKFLSFYLPELATLILVGAEIIFLAGELLWISFKKDPSEMPLSLRVINWVTSFVFLFIAVVCIHSVYFDMGISEIKSDWKPLSIVAGCVSIAIVAAAYGVSAALDLKNKESFYEQFD